MMNSETEPPIIILYDPGELLPGEMYRLRVTYHIRGLVRADAAIVDEMYVDDKGRVTGALVRHERMGECHVYLLDFGGLDHPVGILVRHALEGVTHYLLCGALRTTPRTTWLG